MQAAINLAEANKREVVLNSEAIMTEKMNLLKRGEASAIKMIAESKLRQLILWLCLLTPVMQVGWWCKHWRCLIILNQKVE